MKLPDVNLLLYAIDEDSPRFAEAGPWVEALFGGSETVALAWTVALAFVRLTTKPQVMTRPFRVDEASTPPTATRRSSASCWSRSGPAAI